MEKLLSDKKRVPSDICNCLESHYGCEVAKKLSDIGNDNCDLGFKNAGSSGEKKAASFIMTEMERIGLKKVDSYSFEVDSWEFRKCNLSYSDPCGNARSHTLSAFAGTDGIDEKEITANLIDVGRGTYADCKNQDIKGKIAFIRVDPDDGYWVGEPAYQLELKGAVAVIVMLDGDSIGNSDEVLNSGDAIARKNIPILNISRQDGRMLEKILKRGPVTATLEIDIALSKGSSQNIVGEIEGDRKDEYILIGAHYDSFFKAYIDDAFGVGAILNIAKAIIESNSRPRYTILFIAHGAEEFGIGDTHYDWCIGSWQQIVNMKPEWRKSVKVFFNVDAVNMDAKELLVQAAPQLYGFIDKCMYEMRSEIFEKWFDGYCIGNINGPYSDDFNYYMVGIPVAIIGRGKSLWRTRYYHTNYDTADDLNESLMDKICLIYCKLICAFDQSKNLPVNICEEIEAFENDINEDVLNREEIRTKALFTELHEMKKKIREAAVDTGEGKQSVDQGVIAAINRKLIATIRGLDFEDNAIYRLSEVQKNMITLNNMIQDLLDGDPQSALEKMEEFYGYSVLRDFEGAVYEYWCMDKTDMEKGSLQWGSGKIERPLDIRGLYRSIMNRPEKPTGYAKTIEEILKLKNIERANAIGHINDIVIALKSMIDLVEERRKQYVESKSS